MCCIIDSFLSDLFTRFRQVFDTIRVSDYIRGSTAGRIKRVKHEKFTDYEYKMMSKKGLLKFVKYTLIFSNAFGFILSIFLGLFGIAYPDKHFPLSYKGREMALCSLFCMLFTTIGYCGAQNHRRILLIVYGATNVIIVIIVVILWFLFKENSILGNKEISNMFITTLAITIAVMFLFSFILAFHIQTFKDDAHDSIVSQSHQLLQQTTAFLQQQQHQHHQHQHQNQQQLPGSHNFGPISSGGGLMLTGHHHHQPQQQAPAGQLLQMQGQHQLHQSLGSTLAAGSGGHVMQSAGPIGHMQLMQPPPPPSVPHLKSSSRAKQPQLAVAMQLPPPQMHSQGILLPPPQVPPPSSQQQTLMRNQSSPLPGQEFQSAYPAQQSQTSRGGPGKSVSHYQKQQQQNSTILQPDSSPPLIGHPAHHRALGQTGATSSSQSSSSRMPPCPVQYCTFQCDRTV